MFTFIPDSRLQMIRWAITHALDDLPLSQIHTQQPRENNPMDENTTPNYIDLAAGIVSAFVTKNSVQRGELPELIASVHGALAKLGNGAAEQPQEPLVPAVPIKKSITPDYVICLDDGKKFKSLKRHLRTAYGLTPEQYRAKWSLPADYPMVAPNYAKARSELATKMGLGQKRRSAKQRRKAA